VFQPAAVTDFLAGAFDGPPLTKIACDMKGALSAVPSFEGRQDVLQKMRDCFKSNVSSLESGHQRRFVLHGLGGTGKTQLVLKFAEEAGNQ
jgi:Cdc6-like AAA superfamily ATPase